MRHLATGVGSMPGADYVDSTAVVFGEVGDLPFLVELPERGPGASMVGRTLAIVTELGADLQPAGWRLTDAASSDQRRARSMLASDLDAAAELGGGSADRFKVQVAGPCSLAATVELPRGDKVLADPGARRDLTQALAEGAGEHVAAVRRRLPHARVVVQLDEPALPSALAGAVPTASGFSRHRALSAAEATASLDTVLAAVSAAGAENVVHCCADDVPFEVLAQTATAALSVDATLLQGTGMDAAAEWVDADRELWLGIVPSGDPTTPPSDADVATSLVHMWSRLGHTEVESLPATVVTPTCGLAGASSAWARTALQLCARAAANLSAEHGSMDR